MNRRFALILFLGLASCINLEAVRKFAAISSEAAKYDALIDDYVEQPSRLSRLDPSDRGNLAQVASRQAQREGLKALYAAVASYMEALGEVAADDLSDYNKELKALGDEVKKGSFFKADEVDVVVKATNTLAKALTDYYRSRELAKLVQTSDKALADLIDKMQTLCDAFNASNELERTKIRQFYGPKSNDNNRNVAELSRLQEAEALDVISRRQEAIETYRRVLAKIRDGHLALAQSDDIQDTEFLKKLYEQARELYQDLKAVYELN